MKITALLVLKSPGDSASASGGGEQQAVVLANASDVSHFGYFQRAAAREFILFVARTVVLRTPAGAARTSNTKSTWCIATTRMASAPWPSPTPTIPSGAPSPSSTSCWKSTKKLLESWRTSKTDVTQPWQYLDDALTKYQDPAEADKLLKIQRDLDETKIILHTRVHIC